MDATAQPVRLADSAQEDAAPQKQIMATAASAFSVQLAASDSSGAENSGSTRQTLRQGSFASTNTGQPLMPPIPDAKPKPAAVHRPRAAATAAAIMQEPPAALVAVVAPGVAHPAGSGTTAGIGLAAIAVKSEPAPYGGGGGSSGVSGAGSGLGSGPSDVAPKSEPCSQPATGQQAVARALCNRQSAARSKERRRAYVVGLEQSVKSLTSQVTEQLTHLHSLACNDTALRAANQALHARVTELTEQLAAADLDRTALRSECEQLRQAPAAAGAGRCRPGKHAQEAVAVEAEQVGGDSPVHSVLSGKGGNTAAQQQASRQRPDSPELLCTTRSQAEPAEWEAVMEWKDDSKDGSPEVTATGYEEGGRSGGSGSELPAVEHQTLPLAPKQQQPAEQRQQQQRGPASAERTVQPAHQQPAQRPARSVRGTAPAAATKQQQQQQQQQHPAGGGVPLPPAASAFQRPSVSTGADAWRPSRVPSIRSGSALAGAWPAVPPVQSGNAYSAAMSWGGRQPSGATDSGGAVADALRSVSAAAAEHSATASRGDDGGVAATAARVRSLSVPGAAGVASDAGGSGCDGGGAGGGKRRKKLHNPLHRASFPPMQSQPSDPAKLMSVAEIDSLVAKYTAAAAPALGSAFAAAGNPGQVTGLRLCSAPGGLQINICKAADPAGGNGRNQAATLVTSASGGISIMDEAAAGQQAPLEAMSSLALDEMAAIFDNILEGSNTFPDLDFLPEAQ